MDKSRRSSSRIAASIQVRYKRKEDFVLEYARDISTGGIFIKSEDPLAVGDFIELQLHLPGLAQEIMLYGKVVRVVKVPQPGRSGIGIAFEKMPESTRDMLFGYLRDMEMEREAVVDRRGRAVRFDQVLEVEYNSVGDFLVDYSENLSKNGIFIKTGNIMPVDTVVPMLFTLPSNERIEVTGRVVHALNAAEAAAMGKSPGMGIEFLHYRGDSQQRLWNYIETLSGNEE